MTVSVKFDDRVWARLLLMAEAQGITVPLLLEASASRLLTGSTRAAQLEGDRDTRRSAHKEALTTEIRKLRRRGLPITAIAERVGYSTSYVSRLLIASGERTWHRTSPKTGHSERKTA